MLAWGGLLSSFTITNSGALITPALASLGQVFPELSYSVISYLSTIAFLAAIPGSLLAGVLISNGVGYRRISMTSALCVLAGGVTPYFAGDFWLWMGCRCLFGIGLGLMAPVGASLVARIFRGEQAIRMQGLGMVVMNVSGTVYSLASGFVATYQSRAVFLLYGFFLLPLTLFWFLPEPENLPVRIKEHKRRSRLPATAWLYVLSSFFLMLFCYPLMLNMSKIIAADQLGSAGTAGIVVTSYTIGGVLAGVLFAYLRLRLGKWLLFATLLLGLVSQLLAYQAYSVAQLIAANLLLGTSAYLLWVDAYAEFGEVCTGDQVSRAAGLFVAATSLGSFLTSPLLTLVERLLGANPRAPLLIGAAAACLLALVFGLGIVAMKRRMARTDH